MNKSGEYAKLQANMQSVVDTINVMIYHLGKEDTAKILLMWNSYQLQDGVHEIGEELSRLNAEKDK